LATYRFAAQLISRAKGRSATAAAAYRAGERIRDERTGEVFDYRRRMDVLHRAIYAPSITPELLTERVALWNAVEAAEKRKDAQVAREIQLSLPHELSLLANEGLLRAFVSEQFVGEGMIADVAIHAAHRGGDGRNIHGHVLLTARRLEHDGFGGKVRDWNERALLERWRSEWAVAVNQALERAAIQERVSHLSYAARGIDREPEVKQGPIATQMERQGRESKAGRDRRAVRNRNKQRELLHAVNDRLDSKIGRERGIRSAPTIAVADRAGWRARREEILSEHYGVDQRGSDIARYWRITTTKDGLAFENARGRFVDDGSELTARHGNDHEIRGMLDAAEAHGWRALAISGSDDFMRRAMRVALDRGFEIRASGRDADILRDVHDAPRATRSPMYQKDREAEWDR